MKWVVAILFVGALVAHAAPENTSFLQISQQAESAREANQLPQAINLYQKALQLRPTWFAGWWEVGSIYYDLDLYSDARGAFQHAQADAKMQAPADAFMGLCEYELRDYPAARTHLSKWRAAGEPGGPSVAHVANFRWAELLIQDGRFFESLSLLDKMALEMGPNPSIAEAMGLAWMQMKYVPETYPPEKREMVWLAGTAALWLSVNKHLDYSMVYLDRLTSRYGDQPNVHLLHGFVDEAAKDTDGAIDEDAKELKISPNSIAAMVQYALLCADAGKQLDEADAAAHRALTLEPGSMRSHFALGRVLVAEKKWAESAIELEKAEQLSPNVSKVHYQLARVYLKLGRKQDAQRESAAFQALERAQPIPGVVEPDSPIQSTEGPSQ
jgi:tetratricopeptide (TPR) repeat protein